EAGHSYEEIIRKVCAHLSVKVGIEEDELYQAFTSKRYLGAIPIGNGTALNHARLSRDIQPEMAMVRIRKSLILDEKLFESLNWNESQDEKSLFAVFFLVSSEEHAGQ